mgnify:CR=1 FL=1|jgi:uncharacterized membrane protein
MLHHVLEVILPEIISFLELLGVIIIFGGGVKAFIYLLINIFKREHKPAILELSKAMAAALEFKMAAEILKSLLIQDASELLVLGGIFALRALMAVFIRYNMKTELAEHEAALAREAAELAAKLNEEAEIEEKAL